MKLSVIKIGGNIVDNPEALDSFLKDFAAIDQQKILVHGGGKVATQVSKALGIETQMVEGRRITDEETLKQIHKGFKLKRGFNEPGTSMCVILPSESLTGKTMTLNSINR